MTRRPVNARAVALSLVAAHAFSDASAPMLAQVPPEDRPPAIECATTVEGRPRIYRFAREDGAGGRRWFIAMRPADRPDAWIRLALPGAAPAFSNGTAVLVVLRQAGYGAVSAGDSCLDFGAGGVDSGEGGFVP